MVQAQNANNERQLSKHSVRPIGLVTIHLPPKIYLDVTDYTLIPGGSTLRLDLNLGQYPLVEGTDWAAATSNEQTAANIVDAINAIDFHAAPFYVVTRARARREGARIIVSGAATMIGGTVAFGVLPAAGVAELIQPAGTEEKFLLSDVQPFDYPLSVASIPPLDYELDPVSREFSIADIDVEFIDDGEIRRIMLDHHLKGRQVDIALGDPTLPENEYHPLGTWYVEDVIPDEGGAITLQCYDAMGFFRDALIAYEQVNEHALGHIENILTAAAGFAGLTGLVDVTTLDPATSEPAGAHHTLSKHSKLLFDMGTTQEEPEPCLDLINSLVMLTGGSFTPNENGEYRYRPYDATATADDLWEADPETGYDVESIEVLETWANISNEIAVDFAKQGERNRTRYVEGDRKSQAEVGRLFSLALTTEWVGAVAELDSSGIQPGNLATLKPGDTSFTITHASRQGFAGSRFRGAPGSGYLADSSGDLDGAATPPRRAYFRLHGPGNDGAAPSNDLPPEIIACDGSAVEGTINENGGEVRSDIPLTIRYDIATTFTDATLGFTNGRGGLGTNTPAEWNKAKSGGIGYDRALVVDITTPYDMIQKRLPRFAHGAPKLAVRTSLAKLKYEVADFIEINGDHVYANHGKDGLDSNTVFEITRKSLDPWSDTPGIEWGLTWVRDDVVPTTIVSPAFPVMQPSIVVEVDLEDRYVLAEDGSVVMTDDLEIVIHE